ncbi:hypothetical protein [Longitalea luteola]|uniref:hypothetical protein n=1 Tax=Longitalea luteola TaxID=2812563 RepID=UPI001A9603F7|nr:hypothetical protein [Longitalea luteola]
MKPVFLFLFAVILLSACNGDNAETGLPFTKDSLIGNWMMIRVIQNAKILSGNSDAFHDYKDSVMAPLYDNLEMAAFRFQPSGVVTIDEGKVEKITGNWQFNDKSELLMQYKYLIQKNKSLFAVKRYWHDSLELENVIDIKEDTMYVDYYLVKLRVNDTIPDLFDPALNKWRERPQQSESDEAIKLRLKQVLYYYSAYFANISGNEVPYFNITKILAPIKFYSGGIGVKRYKEDDDWTKVFYDNQDAKKAHVMLNQAFDNIKGYPDQGRDYVKEYIVALKLVADAL